MQITSMRQLAVSTSIIAGLGGGMLLGSQTVSSGWPGVALTAFGGAVVATQGVAMMSAARSTPMAVLGIGLLSAGLGAAAGGLVTHATR